MALKKDRPSSDAAAITPRLLSKTQAAAYLGITPRGFDRWRKDGKIPQPLPGTARWDKVAIDASIDDLSKLSSLKSTKTVPATEEADPLAKFRKKMDDDRENRRRKTR